MKDNTVQSLREIVACIDQILGEAQTAYTHEVDALIHENCSDPERIEHLLDGLLDFIARKKETPLFRGVGPAMLSLEGLKLNDTYFIHACHENQGKSLQVTQQSIQRPRERMGPIRLWKE